ncbi:MAG: pyridoxamine 5'-phosphate oxidase family protein [Acidimicrobiia bacterium]|jgi:hypothetical protein
MKITRRRPGIPESYGVASGEEGMLLWDDVSAALAAASVYWVSTVGQDGGPHLIPLWGAWVQDLAFIEGGDDTRWARNLTDGDGRLHVGIDHEGMQVMVRGVASAVTVAGAMQTVIADGYEDKYPYRPEGSRFWRITPEHVLAWKTDTIEAFGSSPTQFVFLR